MNAISKSGRHVCPRWLAYTLDNPIRPPVHPPERIPGEYVSPGMTVLDIGCGFGHISIGMARIVRPRLSGDNDLDAKEPLDFAPAANPLHEVSGLSAIAGQITALLEPGGFFCIMAPSGHVREGGFEDEVELCRSQGLSVAARPKVVRERCAVLRKPEELGEL